MMFQSVEKDKAILRKSNLSKMYCSKCGMSLIKFYKTNHYFGNEQVCSMHCLLEILKDNSNFDEIEVVTADELKFRKVKEVYYVVGSKKEGTMTSISKYAFSNIDNANKFQIDFGGEICNFEKALEKAKENYENDLKMIIKKRESKVYESGKKIFENNKIDKINLDKFENIADLKFYLKKNNEVLEDNQLQALSLFLWDKIK